MKLTVGLYVCVFVVGGLSAEMILYKDGTRKLASCPAKSAKVSTHLTSPFSDKYTR